MLLFTATSVEHVIPFDDTYEELVFKGQLEICFELTGNKQINDHWLEVGRSICDFVLCVRCRDDVDAINDRAQPIRIDGRLAFKDSADAKGSGTAYLDSRRFGKLLSGINLSSKCIRFPFGELGSSYTKREDNAFECKIQMDLSQITIDLGLKSHHGE
jgi:hypothetical protein